MKIAKRVKALPLLLFFLIILISAACSPYSPEPGAQYSASDSSSSLVVDGPAVDQTILAREADTVQETAGASMGAAANRITAQRYRQPISLQSASALNDSASVADTAPGDTAAAADVDSALFLRSGDLLAMQDGIDDDVDDGIDDDVDDPIDDGDDGVNDDVDDSVDETGCNGDVDDIDEDGDVDNGDDDSDSCDDDDHDGDSDDDSNSNNDDDDDDHDDHDDDDHDNDHDDNHHDDDDHDDDHDDEDDPGDD
jgi:hypothetical protein